MPAQLPTIVIDSEIPCAFGRSLTLTTSTSIAEPDVNTCTPPAFNTVWIQILWGEAADQVPSQAGEEESAEEAGAALPVEAYRHGPRVHQAPHHHHLEPHAPAIQTQLTKRRASPKA